MPSETLSSMSGPADPFLEPGTADGENSARSAALPCHDNDPDLWFAESPTDLEQAKSLCTGCPVRDRCLAAALEREEPWGVWGGEILDRGTVVARKRPRGRPRKNPVAEPQKELVCA